MKNAILVFVFALLVVCSKAGADTQPLWKTVEGWDIRVDTTLENSCFLYSPFQDGTAFRVGFNRKTRLGHVIIGNSAWASLEPGKEYDLDVQFDAEAPWNGTGRAVKMGSETLLVVEFGESDFLREFMRKQAVVFRYKGRQITKLSLRGSSLAGAELVRCQQAMNEARGYREGQSSDPFSENHKSSHRDPFSY